MIERCVTHLERVSIDEKIENKTWSKGYIEYDRLTTIKCSYCGYIYVVNFEHITYKITKAIENDGTICHTLSKPKIERKEY